MTEPTIITAGLSYSWTKVLADYKASAGWVLTYSIVSNLAQYTVTTTANVDAHDTVIAKTASSDYEPGQYRLIGYVDKAAERIQVYCRDIFVQPDFTAVGDLRSYAEKTLEAIEAVLGNAATKDQESFMVDGQTLVRRKFPDLIVMRDRFLREVRNEKRAADIASGVSSPNRVQLRFTR